MLAGYGWTKNANDTNYLYYGWFWSLFPQSSDIYEGSSTAIFEGVRGMMGNGDGDGSEPVRPVINLKSDVLIINVNGDGTKDNPYILG